MPGDTTVVTAKPRPCPQHSRAGGGDHSPGIPGRPGQFPVVLSALKSTHVLAHRKHLKAREAPVLTLTGLKPTWGRKTDSELLAGRAFLRSPVSPQAWAAAGPVLSWALGTRMCSSPDPVTCQEDGDEGGELWGLGLVPAEKAAGRWGRVGVAVEERKPRLFIPSLPRAEQHGSPCHWRLAETQGQAGGGELHGESRGRLRCTPMGGRQLGGALWDAFGEPTGLPLADPKLDTGTKIREAARGCGVPALWAGCCRLRARALCAHTGWPCLRGASHPGHWVLPQNQLFLPYL